MAVQWLIGNGPFTRHSAKPFSALGHHNEALFFEFIEGAPNGGFAHVKYARRLIPAKEKPSVVPPVESGSQFNPNLECRS